VNSKNHYSYEVYADPVMAERFDAMRFSGPIGRLIADTQARQILSFLAPIDGRRVLDVGTGTGRAAIALAKAGAVVASGALKKMRTRLDPRRAREEQVRVTFVRGDAHRLDFPDRSFDAVVCLRVLMHTPQWQQCIAELCRVAQRLVVVDYPSSAGFARLESWSRRALHLAGASEEPYRVFSDRAIADAFSRHNFRIRSVHRQFVMPIALHKAIGSRRFTLGIESALDRAGLLKRFGSPVSIVAERCASS